MQQASTTALPDQQGISYPTPSRQTPNEPQATASRLRTVTGNRFPRKCSCGCGHAIPRDPEVRYVVDFGAMRPYPAYLREHSPDFGSYRGRPGVREDLEKVPGFVSAAELLARPTGPKPPTAPRPEVDPAHSEADASPTPEAGRPWASGQLVFNAGHLCIFRFEDELSSAAIPGGHPRESTPAVAPRCRYMIFIG